MNTTNTLSTDRLKAARAGLQALKAQDQKLITELGRIGRQAAPAGADVGAVAELSAKRQGIFDRLLREGLPTSTVEKELAALDAQIQTAAAKAETARGMLAAAAQLEAEINAKRAQNHEAARAAEAELRAAVAEAVAAQFEDEAIPDLIDALEALRQAVGRVYGTKLAMDRMRFLQSHGPYEFEPNAATRTVYFDLCALGMEERLRGHATLRAGNYNGVILDAGSIIDQVARDTLAACTTTA